MAFKSNCSVFFYEIVQYPNTWTSNSIPNTAYTCHASLKCSIHVVHSQIVIEANLVLHVSGQQSPNHSTVVHSDCVGIVLKQNIFATMARPLHEIFASFAKKNSKKSPNTKTARQCTNANNGSKVNATISLQERTVCCVVVGQCKLVWIMMTLVSIVRLVSLHNVHENSTVFVSYEQSQLHIIITIILDGFVSSCMRIYCTCHERYSTRPPAHWISFMARAVYSHTTLNAIQYYINLKNYNDRLLLKLWARVTAIVLFCWRAQPRSNSTIAVTEGL